MAPPGRRTALLTSIFLFLSIFSFTASAASAVLGIDLGTEYIKAALVKPGIPLEIVLTKDSKRKEVSAVALKPLHNAQKKDDLPERIYGSDAMALAARYPGDVYPNLKPLLGQRLERSELVEQYKRSHPALELVRDQTRATAAFVSKALGKAQDPFTVEELLAMELQNIRSNAETLAGRRTIIKDVVIAVPAFFTAQEIRALELAAELAGLKVLGLISDGLAVGVNYATSRAFPSVKEGGKAERHLVFDMGAGSTTASILEFQQKTVKDVGKYNKTFQDIAVLATSHDRSLGGDALNAAIVDHMVDEFVKGKGAQGQGVAAESVKVHGRAMAKLLKDAERVRQVLSANSETSTSFEGLYDDIDFRYKITRSQFEDMASAFTERVKVVVKRALEASKMAVDELDSVILHGGATRTPIVQSTLEQLLGGSTKIRSNVNADEAAVFGAAFRGASLSPRFRVKEIQAKEATPYSFGIEWPVDGKDRRQKLFVPTSQRGVEKHVPFKNLQDFAFTLYQDDGTASGESESESNPIAKIQTQNLTASVAQLKDKAGCAAANITTTFVFRLGARDGLPEVAYGTVACTLDYVEKKGGVVDDVKGFFGFGGKQDEQEPMGEGSSAGESSSTSEPAASEAASPSASSATVNSTAGNETKKAAEASKATETIHLQFTTENQGIPDVSKPDLDRMKKRLAAFDASDKARRMREESLNTLEAFIYRARDQLTDESFIASSSDKERSQLEAKLGAASDWLYEDGADAARDELKARLKQLKDLVDPVEKRRHEAASRPRAVEFIRDALNQTQALVSAMQEHIDKASAEAASASASSASSASSPFSSSESAASAPASDSTASASDQSADLEDSSSSSTSTSTATAPSPSLDPPLYTAEDIADLQSSYDSIRRWLDTKLGEQGKLSAQDDPVILTSDIEAKSKELNRVVMNIVERQMRKPVKQKTSSSSSSSSSSSTKVKTKSKKTKKAHGATSSKDSQTPAASEDTVAPEATGTQIPVDAEPELKKEHDEL